ncbi:hypothetical protein LCGC14_1622250 [marine sediment metagenome]|uniref:Uncharacterized protein n=1 Tax=marine sediment metagenome TaxID=412755 RepID=A0A0F9KKP7_9ZZZZ
MKKADIKQEPKKKEIHVETIRGGYKNLILNALSEMSRHAVEKKTEKFVIQGREARELLTDAVAFEQALILTGLQKIQPATNITDITR